MYFYFGKPLPLAQKHLLKMSKFSQISGRNHHVHPTSIHIHFIFTNEGHKGKIIHSH
jgi:hypothetical protein